MRKTVEKIFRRYGVPILVDSAQENRTVYGFVQHTATSARKHLLPEYTPLGKLPQGHYLMLLPLLSALSCNDVLRYNDKAYIVRRLEKVWFGAEAIYCWCLCEERGEVDQWGV